MTTKYQHLWPRPCPVNEDATLLRRVVLPFFIIQSFPHPFNKYRVLCHCRHAWSLTHVHLFAIPRTVCSPPGFSIHGILHARILEWVAILFSMGSFQPRNWTWVSYIAGRLFTIWATQGSPLSAYYMLSILSGLKYRKMINMAPILEVFIV